MDTAFFLISVRRVYTHSTRRFLCFISIKIKATQWKNWGNELHKEKKYDLMADYYTLALDFTPPSNSELITALLSNRCLALINLGKFSEALTDAEKCTKIRPKWFRVSGDNYTPLLNKGVCWLTMIV